MSSTSSISTDPTLVPDVNRTGDNPASQIQLQKNSSKSYNGTGYYVDNDEVDPNFTDLQTLFLACFATLVPLILSLVTAFVVRYLWRKYRTTKECSSYDGVVGNQQTEAGSERASSQSGPLHSHLLASDQNTVNVCESSIGDAEDGSGSPVMYSGSSSRTNHASANGSIITMTLKNNHLIVETEERNDLTEEGRETTMKYSPSAKDGVFVVEVQQGVRREGNNSPNSNDQKAEVHNPPDKFDDQEPRLPSKSISTYTGLSQSNSSLNQAPSYRYGNQQGYDNGYYGYPYYHGYLTENMIIAPVPIQTETNPGENQISNPNKETGKMLRGYSIDTGQPILLSDIQARDEAEHRLEVNTNKLQNSVSQDSTSAQDSVS